MSPRLRTLLAILVVGLAGAAAVLLGRGGEAAPAGDPLVGRVRRVVDGDTFHVRLPAGEETVRVLGIDTPEVAHEGRPAACYGDQAAAWVRTRLDGREVRLTRGIEPVDRFGRSLARVEVLTGPPAGRDLSRALAAAGLARTLAIEPNTSDAPAIAAAVAAARRSRTGLWAACGFARAFPGKG